MNRDRGISSNLRLYLHLIYPSRVHTPPTSPFICLCFLLFLIPQQTLFPFLPSPFCLSARASIRLFPSYKFLDCSVFISNFCPPPTPFRPLPTPPLPVLQRCQRSIRQLCSGWRGWRPGAVPCSECLGSPSPSVCPPGPLVLN